MLPAAPERFSTTTGWPSGPCARSAIRRAKMSVEPPGANGTIRRSGFDGYCAFTGKATSANTSKKSFISILVRRIETVGEPAHRRPFEQAHRAPHAGLVEVSGLFHDGRRR